MISNCNQQPTAVRYLAPLFQIGPVHPCPHKPSILWIVHGHLQKLATLAHISGGFPLTLPAHRYSHALRPDARSPVATMSPFRPLRSKNMSFPWHTEGSFMRVFGRQTFDSLPRSTSCRSQALMRTSLHKSLVFPYTQ